MKSSIQKLAKVNVFDDAGYGKHQLYENDRYEAARNQAYVPPLAFNGEQLKLVLLHRCWRYVHHNKPAPSTWDYEFTNAEATRKALAGHEIDESAPKQQNEMQADHKKAVQRAGGYLELQTAIAWRSWREGQSSPQVAVSLGVSPWMVRQSLRRLRGVAVRLGFDVGRRHHSLRAGVYSERNGWSR